MEADPDALIAEVTGQRLPVRRLPYWLLGRAPGVSNATAAAARCGPTRGRLADRIHLWRRRPGALPAGVTVTRGSEVELRLRLEEWRQAP